jgi:enamine deaminase RidA (YjgF/YER057c/UK114 family)
MRALILALFLLTAGSASAQDYPIRLPSPGGEVILPSAGAKKAHDEWRYAAARRAGDTLYVSGVVVFRAPGEANDAEAFKAQARRGFEQLKQTLTSSGASFADVAMINTFHVWDGPNFAGTKDQQFTAFETVVGEYLKAPYPAWTAVGTTGLLGETGIVEVQLIVHSPARKP